MEIKIEKSIPLPSRGRGRKPIYPFGDMDVGDSFAVSGLENRVTSAASWFGKRHGKKFTLRTNSETGETRVWRIA